MVIPMAMVMVLVLVLVYGLAADACATMWMAVHVM